MGISKLLGGDSGKSQARANTRAAQIQSDAAIRAAELGRDGALGAAGAVAGATMYSADLQLEAQEMALAEQERQFNATEARFAPYVELGSRFIEDVANASTIEGFDDRITQILSTDSFKGLRAHREKSADAQLAKAGITRSGQAAREAADIDVGLATQIEGQMFGRMAGNVDRGQAAVAQVSNAGANYANQVSNIVTGTAANIGNQAVQGGIAQGSFLMDAATISANGIQNAANAQAGGMVDAANARAQGRQNRQDGIMSLVSLGVGLFSDERLKDNMEPIGSIEDLTLYEWDWKAGVDKIAGCEMSIGFKAQEVDKKYPDCIIKENNLLMIDYPKLHKKLRSKLDMRVAA